MEPITAADPRMVGEFRLRARLGAGGMGQVFLATSPAGRAVAVKIIHTDLARDSEFVLRFAREVAAARMVSGLYTAPVVSAGVGDNPPWLATAFVPGPALNDVVARHGPLPVPALLRLAAGLAEALRAIHASGLIHRDLKPANVLLAADGPRVIDFGISRALDGTRMTATGTVMGTPGYMAPEQVQGFASGPPGDVFSLGCVLAYAARGDSPFSGDNNSSAAVLYRIVHAEPMLDGVPREVRDLIGSCLAKDPARRPDLADVASWCATAAEHAGMSPAKFWPDDVAGLINAHQAMFDDALRTLPAPDTAARPAWDAQGPRPGTHAGNGRAPDGPGTNWAGSAGQPVGGTWPRPDPGPAAPPWAGPGAAATHAPAATSAPAGHAASGTRATPGAMSRRRLLAGAGAASVAVAGAITGWKLTSGSAPRAGGALAMGAAGSGRGQSAPPADAGLRTGAQVWRLTTTGVVNSNLAVINGIVYAGNEDNLLYAVDGGTGRKRWAFSTPNGNGIRVAPTVAGGLVYITSSDGNLYAIHAATGAKAWQFTTGFGLTFVRNWAVAGGRVFATTESGGLHVLDAATGARVNSFTTTYGFVEPVAANAGVVYAIDTFGTIYALRAAGGRQIWSYSGMEHKFPGTDLLLAGGTLYVGAVTGTLYAVDAATGRERWTYPAGGTLIAAPVVANGTVYIVDGQGHLHALDAATGAAKWTYGTPSLGSARSLYGPAAAGGSVYFPVGSSLHQFAAADGRAGWSFTPDNPYPLFSTPAAANGLVYIGCEDYTIYALKA